MEYENNYEKAAEALGKEGKIILTKDNLTDIHDYGIEKYGGLYGVRDENLLDSVSKAPYQDMFGSELYPTPFDKAAKYLVDFARYQIFLDGNKRTGLYASVTYLKMNNIKLELSSMDMYNMTMNIANGKITEASDVSRIFRENSVYKYGRTELEGEGGDYERD